MESNTEIGTSVWQDSRAVYRGKDEQATSAGPLLHGPGSIGYPTVQSHPSEAWVTGGHLSTQPRPVSGPYQSMSIAGNQQHGFQHPIRSHGHVAALISQAPGVLGQIISVGSGIGRPMSSPYPLQPGGVVPALLPFVLKDQSFVESSTSWSVPVSVPQKKRPHATLLPPQVVLQHEGLHAAFHSRPVGSAGLHIDADHATSSPPMKPVSATAGAGPAGSYSADLQYKVMQPPLPVWHSHRQQDRGVHMHREQELYDQYSAQQIRSKYMTSEEIENIVRIQWAATHSSDPYLDDYYHLAVQAKVEAGGIPHGRRPFAPSHLREQPSHTRPTVEPHAFLQIKALGRVPFPSIRRPRPLVEVESVNTTDGRDGVDQLIAETKKINIHRPLEQEPMLAVRIAAEDGLCLLLDVDDIDRFLAVTRPPDGGNQLRRRRQQLLEGLASSLNLSGNREAQYAKDAGPFDAYLGDNLMFLRLVSLPKGRKLVTKYLKLLLPGTELVTVAVLLIFRNLNYLFGGELKDARESGVNTGLANSVAMCVSGLSLSPLSALLAAVVFSPEYPPLRPIGNPAGDGATVVIMAVLERATALLTHHNAAYHAQRKISWQAAFDAFFSLLTSYCTKKYDSIIHTMVMSSSGDMLKASTAATASMSNEIPVELLKACLPHTNEQQRRQLLEFTQRSIGISGHQPPS